MQQIEEPGFAGFSPGLAGGIGAEQCRYYPSQSAQILLKVYFEQNPPTSLDPTHSTTNLSAVGKRYLSPVGLKMELASYGMLEDALLKANVGQSAVA